MTFAFVAFMVLLSAFLTEAVTELVIKSDIFKYPRNKLKKLPFLNSLLSCGYCFSFWVAASVVIVLNSTIPLTGKIVVDGLVTALLVQRFSNFIHNFNDKYLDKYYSLSHINSDQK